jgi:hypothetical protein
MMPTLKYPVLKTLMSRGTLLLGVLSLLSPLTSTALHAAAPNIGGDVSISVSTEEITNAAVGDNASAQVIVGSFMEGESGGDLEITVSTGTVSNIAEGDGACSQVVIGSIVGSSGCIASEP